MGFHKLTIRNTAGEGLLHGTNTEIILDGMTLRGVRSLFLFVPGAGEFAKVYLTLNADVEFEGSLIKTLKKDIGGSKCDRLILDEAVPSISRVHD